MRATIKFASVSPALGKLFTSIVLILLLTEDTIARLKLVIREHHPQIATILQVPERFESIQVAIEAADHGDTVLISPGEYNESIDFQGKRISVASMYIFTSMREYIDSTVIIGVDDASVVNFLNGETRQSRLCGVTVSGGRSGFGGGIYCGDESSPTIDYCRITDNHANGLGGGIIAWQNSHPLLDHCEIFGNTANSGAGLVSRSGSQPVLINCIITENQADNDAGGVYCLSGGMPIIINTTLWNNFPEEVFFKDTGSENAITMAYCSLRNGTDQIFLEDNGEAEIIGGLVADDPVFSNPEQNLFSLEWNSHCIDAGSTLFISDGDTLLRLNENQFLGESAEIGAYEYDPNYAPYQKNVTVKDFALQSIYPNPVNGSVKIDFRLNSPGLTFIRLFDHSGRIIASLNTSYLPAGNHFINWNLTTYNSGSYLLELHSGNSKDVKKLVILK